MHSGRLWNGQNYSSEYQILNNSEPTVLTRRIVECELSFVSTADMLSGISRPRPRRTKPVFYIEGQLRTDSLYKVPSNVASEC